VAEKESCMKKRLPASSKNARAVNKVIQIAQMAALIVAAAMIAKAFKLLFLVMK
jgi:hypothetical protein